LDLELVTIHDRPEGSKLGKYNYIIEVEADGGITDAQINAVSNIDKIRFLGSFDTVLK
jgi:prephenate dehydratase